MVNIDDERDLKLGQYYISFVCVFLSRSSRRVPLFSSSGSFILPFPLPPSSLPLLSLLFLCSPSSFSVLHSLPPWHHHPHFPVSYPVPTSLEDTRSHFSSSSDISTLHRAFSLVTTGKMDEPPRPRSRRNGNNDHQSLSDHLNDLSVRSKLDEFRRFFDLRADRWREFREALHKLVRDTSSWPDVQQDEHERSVCANDFIAEVGFKYWGTAENREKNLMPDHISSGFCCEYPRDADL